MPSTASPTTWPATPRARHPLIEASTYLPDLTPPVTSVDGTTGTNPSTVNTATGTFTLNLTGSDPGGGVVTYFEVFVSVDSGAVHDGHGTAIPAGPPDSSGNVHATIPYQGLTDGAAAHLRVLQHRHRRRRQRPVGPDDSQPDA